MSGSLAQFGFADETTWGTAVAVTRFFEASKESVAGKYDRVQADGLSASYFDRADRYVPAPKGAEGDIDIEVLSSGFGFFLKHMLGSVETNTSADPTVYVHTATPGNLFGKSFTYQVGRPHTDDSLQPWTYSGGKVTKFSFANSPDKTLNTTISMDFKDESNPTSPSAPYTLATPSLPTGAEVLAWVGGELTIGGTVIPVTDFSLDVDNALKTDRYFMRKSTAKSEQVGEKKRAISWKFTADYDDDTLWRMVSAAQQSGSQAQLVASWEGLNLAGTSLYPKITITVPVARFDEGAPAVGGPELLDQSFSGVGLDNGTDPAIQIDYQTVDATP